MFYLSDGSKEGPCASPLPPPSSLGETTPCHRGHFPQVTHFLRAQSAVLSSPTYADVISHMLVLTIPLGSIPFSIVGLIKRGTVSSISLCAVSPALSTVRVLSALLQMNEGMIGSSPTQGYCLPDMGQLSSLPFQGQLHRAFPRIADSPGSLLLTYLDGPGLATLEHQTIANHGSQQSAQGRRRGLRKRPVRVFSAVHKSRSCGESTCPESNS